MSSPGTCIRRGVLATSILLVACGGPRLAGHGAPGTYQLDSATNACRTNLAYCATVVGKEVATVGATLRTFDSATKPDDEQTLDDDTRRTVEQVLVECAQLAQDQVNARYFKGITGPTAKQCAEEVKVRGRKMTRAMELGEEKHRLALQCVRDKLRDLLPGRFLLEPHYRYDPGTKRLTLIPAETVRALEQTGNSAELQGTVAPDVVIHSGNPLQPQAVYDFKFPCPIHNFPQWSGDGSQGRKYEEALKVTPFLVAPRYGVTR